MVWKFAWPRNWDEVWAHDLQSAWGQLLEQAPRTHVYHRPEVVRAWAETSGKAVSAEPMIGLASDDAGHRILLPWVIVPYAGRFIRRRVLEPAGRSFFGYHDPLVGAGGSGRIEWSAFWEAARQSVRRSCDHALFRFVSPGYCQDVPTESCGDESPVLNLEGLASLDAALARCSANHRGDVKRRLRRLQEKGEVTLWVADAGEAELAVSDFREHFGPAYRQIWRQQPGSNLFRQPGFANYAERILGEGLAAGWAHYAVLRVAGTPVAWHLGLFHQEGLYWWMPTYDAAWENLSPGKVLLAKLIEHAISQKWRRLHFLTGGQSYKLAWKPDKPDLRTIRWRAPGLRAALLAGYDAIQRSRGAVA